MTPDVDLLWRVAFWIVVVVALAVSILACVILVLDWREFHAADRVSRDRARLDAATRSRVRTDLLRVSPLRPHDARRRDRGAA